MSQIPHDISKWLFDLFKHFTTLSTGAVVVLAAFARVQTGWCLTCAVIGFSLATAASLAVMVLIVWGSQTTEQIDNATTEPEVKSQLIKRRATIIAWVKGLFAVTLAAFICAVGFLAVVVSMGVAEDGS